MTHAPRGPRRVLAVASGGGHWVQLLRLRPALAGHDVTWATVDARYREDVGFEPFVVVPDATRWSPFGLLRVAAHVLVLVLRTRPHVVVTTGAAPGLIAAWIGRLVGARTAWIDSLANVRRPSLSGRLAARACRLHLTQWPALAQPKGPHFLGRVA